jgi:hypothetical protein
MQAVNRIAPGRAPHPTPGCASPAAIWHVVTDWLVAMNRTPWIGFGPGRNQCPPYSLAIFHSRREMYSRSSRN